MTTEATTLNNASGPDSKHRNDATANIEMDDMQAHPKMQQSAQPVKKAKDATKAAANL